MNKKLFFESFEINKQTRAAFLIASFLRIGIERERRQTRPNKVKNKKKTTESIV